jgi:hypothetical protein
MRRVLIAIFAALFGLQLMPTCLTAGANFSMQVDCCQHGCPIQSQRDASDCCRIAVRLDKVVAHAHPAFELGQALIQRLSVIQTLAVPAGPAQELLDHQAIGPPANSLAVLCSRQI